MNLKFLLIAWYCLSEDFTIESETQTVRFQTRNIMDFTWKMPQMQTCTMTICRWLNPTGLHQLHRHPVRLQQPLLQVWTGLSEQPGATQTTPGAQHGDHPPFYNPGSSAVHWPRGAHGGQRWRGQQCEGQTEYWNCWRLVFYLSIYLLISICMTVLPCSPPLASNWLMLHASTLFWLVSTSCLCPSRNPLTP